jgi:hypothetical protein
MVARVSPSATTYDSPAATGEGLGDGLGNGDGDGGAAGLFSGDGLAGADTPVVAVGGGGFPPTNPQAVTSTVPTINPWTSQRGLRLACFENIVSAQYGVGVLDGAELDRIDAGS